MVRVFNFSLSLGLILMISLMISFFCGSFKSACAEPQPLAKILVPQKLKKGTPKPALTDFEIYEQAQKVFESKKLQSLNLIDATEKAVVTAKLIGTTKALEKELEELLWALELRKGETATMKKLDQPAIQAFQRAVAGISTLKLPFFWREPSSKALYKLCTRTKKKNNPCLMVAKKIMDAFPKAAQEVAILRTLPAPEVVSAPENNEARLWQTYPADKTDRDEQDFDEVLEAFLGDHEEDLQKHVDDFIKEYPKSYLRFRAQFLLAEMKFSKGNVKEAEPLYQGLLQQNGLGFYALVAAERLKVNLRDRLVKSPLQVDPANFNFNPQEEISLSRVEELHRLKKDSEVSLELDSLQRTRSYTTDSIVYLMGLAQRSHQGLSAFRFVTELIQREYAGLYNAEMLGMIFPFEQEAEINFNAKKYAIDPLIVMSLMKQESGFKANVISGSGALGLMQLMPLTALDTQSDVVLSNLKDPVQNIQVGTKYLASLIEKYEGNLVYALAAYNAGPHRVAKWRKDLKPSPAPTPASGGVPSLSMIQFIESIPFKETRDYVTSILRNRYWYQVRKGLEPSSLFETWKP